MSTPGNLGWLAGGRSLQRVALDYTNHVIAAEGALDAEPCELADLRFAVRELAAAARDNAAFMGTAMALLETLRPKTVPR